MQDSEAWYGSMVGVLGLGHSGNTKEYVCKNEKRYATYYYTELLLTIESTKRYREQEMG